MEERLQKIISDYGLASRRAAEKLIEEGRVTVNGAPAQIGMKADPTKDIIRLDGRPLESKDKRVYIMLNKPRGYVCTLKDEKDRKTVTELVADCGTRVYPVGRLDVASEGLLLLTNDGDFCHKIISPKSDIKKEYYVRLAKPLDENAVERFASGIHLGDGTVCLPAQLKILPGDLEALVTVSEGKYHQVKRMVWACGSEVTYLKRLAIGGLRLNEAMQKGETMELTDSDYSNING